ncbi:hypothetical protein DFH09DRAFT_1076280 [Mycena vulgaris]|nr:hypothetical protein DFH09DRAFT_1076280 [Mycena vulgaris]
MVKMYTDLGPRPNPEDWIKCEVKGFPECLSVLQFRGFGQIWKSQSKTSVDDRISTVLSQTGNWKAQNICPPCFYKTEREPKLKLSYMATIDNNSSLKLVDSSFLSGKTSADNHTSKLWFKDDVATAQKKPKKKSANPASEAVSDVSESQSDGAPPVNQPVDNDDNDIAWLNVNELQAEDAHELEACINVCVERWRAAAPEVHKKMFHDGNMVVATNQEKIPATAKRFINRVDRMKYLLVIVNHLFNKYDAEPVIGYDIMCAFIKTLLSSSLGAHTIDLRMQGVVPAFHGHAHNRECQIGWHPLYVEGMGIEDFEESLQASECERTFAESNNLASVTHLATPFHRQQQLNEHFDFHDLDKHASSGNFIFQNYRQALKRINKSLQQLRALEEKTKTSGPDYEHFLEEERVYFKSKKTEDPAITRKVDYMELLVKLQNASLTWFSTASNEAKRDYQRRDYDIIHNGFQAPQIQAALDKLESLVVKQLFELTKFGMSGVGYKLREKISQALHMRVQAIRTALEQYNVAVSQLNPSQEHFTWASIIDATTLSEFDLLRETKTDIRSLPWANPFNREAMVLYFHVKQAKEEINRLNVEIHCTLAFLFRKLTRLQGFTGSLFPGTHIGCDPAINDSETLPLWAAQELGIQRTVVEYDECNINVDSDDEGNMWETEGVEDLMVQLMERLDVQEVDV